MLKYTFAVAILVLSSIAAAADARFDALSKSCAADLKLSPAACACLMTKIRETLNDNQIAFVAASVSRNQQAMIAAQGKLTGDEMIAVANFMTTAPSECAASN